MEAEPCLRPGSQSSTRTSARWRGRRAAAGYPASAAVTAVEHWLLGSPVFSAWQVAHKHKWDTFIIAAQAPEDAGKPPASLDGW